MFCFYLTSSKVILSRVQHHCFLHTLNLKKGSPRLYSLLTLLTALQRRNRLLSHSVYPRHPKHIAVCYSPGTSFLRNINTTFPTGRKECSSPPKGNLFHAHPPRQAKKQNTIRAWSAQTNPRGKEPSSPDQPKGPEVVIGQILCDGWEPVNGMVLIPPMFPNPMCARTESQFLSLVRVTFKTRVCRRKGDTLPQAKVEH